MTSDKEPRRTDSGSEQEQQDRTGRARAYTRLTWRAQGSPRRWPA
jgi:hypothetical protein